jgi:cell division control protein 7
LYKLLAHLNKLGIVHRDVKPANYLFQRATLQGQLTDFGLSEYLNKKDVYSLNKMSFDDKCYKSDCINSSDSVCSFCIAKPAQRVSRSGSPGFRAPEILIKSHRQDGMIDVWAAGICLLSTLARRYPFFPRADDFDALIQIGALVGSENLTRACNALNKKISISFLKMPEESQLHDSVRSLRFDTNYR